MLNKPKILIVTANFGDGHNSAAKNIAAAFNQQAECKVTDPAFLANPQFNKHISQSYQRIINHTPTLWALLYHSADLVDLNKPSKVLTKKPEQEFGKQIEEFQPDAIVSTYPIYPYYAKRYFEKTGNKIPVYTIITDSIRINKAWTNAPTDYFIVTDEFSKKIVEKRSSIAPENILNYGFPVPPSIHHLKTISAQDDCKPFNVLYFTTGQKTNEKKNIATVLSHHPDIKVTLILGRKFRMLYPTFSKLKTKYGNRLKILGWTKKVPLLMTTHHLVIGKAGGATTHESIAAKTPMLIHHFLPGQEQGNLELLEKLKVGSRADSQEKLKKALENISENNFSKWREMKHILSTYSSQENAVTCCEHIVKIAKKTH